MNWGTSDIVFGGRREFSGILMDQSTEDDMSGGDRARVVTQLVEEHYELLYRFAYRLSGSAADAEDLTQQAFLTAQEKLGQLREDGKARSWLLTIVRNTYLKSRRRPDFASFAEFDGSELADDPVPDGPIDEEELQAALNEMPTEFRLPVILFYFQEMSYKQIADHLGVPAGTVMSRLSRGKAFLRKRLQSRLDSATAVSSDSKS